MVQGMDIVLILSIRLESVRRVSAMVHRRCNSFHASCGNRIPTCQNLRMLDGGPITEVLHIPTHEGLAHDYRAALTQ